MILKFPLKRTYKNMLLTKTGSLFAYYRVTPEIISRANINEKYDYKSRFVTLLDDVVKYKDIHLKMLPKNMNLQERFEVLSDDYDSRYKLVADYYGAEAIKLLERELGQVTRYEFYIGVRMDRVYSDMEDVTDSFKNAVSNVTDKIASSLGFEIEVTDDYFDKYLVTEQNIFNNLRVLDIRRCTEDELNYLLRYNLGNVYHSVEEESSLRGSLQICNGELDNTEKCILKIDTENATIYKSYLVVEATDYIMNNLHLFETLQSQTYPVEVDLKLKPVDKAVFNVKLSHKIRSKYEEMKEEFMANDKFKDESLKNNHLMERIENEVEQQKNFVEWLMVITLSNTDKSELIKQTKLVKNEFKRRINLIAPIADQLQLFYHNK